MKVEWDYSGLADAYLKRPDYCVDALSKLFVMAGISRDSSVCDVGAGVGHLTLHLAKLNCRVVAVEPNDAMRQNGQKRTENLKNVTWYEGTGEETGQPTSSFHLVTFGSSFNVTNRELALIETNRILVSGGWFACLWNHRDLSDPLQERIEAIIKKHITGYDYGARREDQREVIRKSGLFREVGFLEGQISHQQAVQDCIEAWKSHATLQRQAGDKFERIIEEISRLLVGLDVVKIPYTTRIWYARKIQ